MKTIAVIDGNSLMHRAYHAVPPTMNAPDGTPTNACFGFLSMMIKMAEDFKPDGIICAFDAGIPEFRLKTIEQYKAQRPHMDDELRVQFPVMEDLLDSLKIPVVKIESWEGDDILGTVAAADEAEGDIQTLLVTGDKDALQLVSDTTKVVNTRKGMTDVIVYDRDGVYDKWGVYPELVPDYLGLMGDSSDNIPGVPGVGPKTATKLLQQYDSMEDVLAHAGDIKGKLGENIRNNVEQARASREVATIIRDVPLDLDVESVAWPAFDAEGLRRTFERYGFFSHMKKILKLAGLGSAGDNAAPQRDGKRAAISGARGTDDDEGVIGTVQSQMHFVTETELPSGMIATNDAKAYIKSHPGIDASKLFDTSIAAYLLNSVNPPEDMEAPELMAALKADGSYDLFNDIEMPLVPVLAQMEQTGVRVDPDVLSAIDSTLADTIDSLKTQAYEHAGAEFNLDSPKQVGEVLFEKLQLPAGKKTKGKTGYSTAASVLKELEPLHPMPGIILEYRELAKLKSTYLDALPKLIAKDGHIHTTFHQTVTATGRLSSSDPNLQNIPVRTDLGREIRTAFVADAGALDVSGNRHSANAAGVAQNLIQDDSNSAADKVDKPAAIFLSADYSQIELRLLAHLSGDENLIAAFKSGEDFHAETAARVFGVPVADVTSQMRSRAKAVNFGIVYGQQAFGLSQSLKIGFGEAQEMIDSYYRAYPQVRSYLDSIVADAHVNGYATTMFGRKRHIPELNAKNATQRSFGERAAMNHPMQGSAADIIKMAMIDVARRLRDDGLKSQMVLQVHDEIDFNCAADEADALGAMVKDAMEHIVELKVPLIADVSTGANWAEAH
ncbi:MAG: DNA polymerase I [Coriobacteriales bacterium]|jgi:DNA polymerase-1|nr:DNA polymerase I [Coriobacteriales bacterium]